MAIIVIQNLSGRKIITDGTTRPLLHHLQANYVDWMHACGGKGRCTTCRVMVVDGAMHVGPLTPAERKYIEMGSLPSDERLACQVLVLGDVTVRVPDEGKLPHLQYSDTAP